MIPQIFKERKSTDPRTLFKSKNLCPWESIYDLCMIIFQNPLHGSTLQGIKEFSTGIRASQSQIKGNLLFRHCFIYPKAVFIKNRPAVWKTYLVFYYELI